MRPADATSVGLRNRRSLDVAVGALNRWNARHPWSHNDHFHGWILRNLPERRATALDVGCGRGALLARLGTHFSDVTGVDPDEEMVDACRERLAGRPSVELRRQSLLDTAGSFDLVTMVASLHHLHLESALHHAAGLVAPGGRLLVVGLAQLGSPTDIAFDSVSLLLNPVVGLVKHPRSDPRPVTAATMPVRDPEETYDEVRAAARQALPGARVRHRLYFRYTLAWER